MTTDDLRYLWLVFHLKAILEYSGDLKSLEPCRAKPCRNVRALLPCCLKRIAHREGTIGDKVASKMNVCLRNGDKVPCRGGLYLAERKEANESRFLCC